MNLSIKCKVSLSKKLRGLVEGQGCSIMLSATDLVNGKGEGVLSISSESDFASQFDTNETSIMITPLEVVDEMPEAQAVGSIFTTGQPEGTRHRTPVDKIAAISAPERGEVAHAIVAQEEVETPQEFEQMKQPSCQNYVKNLDELLTAAREASNKSVDVDIGEASNDRQKALLLEKKEKGESIDIPAYVVNDQAGILSINDLGITLSLNAPYNLANLSGRKVAESGELRGLLRAGIVKFISPEKAQEYMNTMDSTIVKAPSLEVFDNVESAEAHMSGDTIAPQHTPDSDVMDLTMEDLEAPTAEENMIIDLTANTGSADQTSSSRTSVHGASPTPKARKRVPTSSNIANPDSNPAHRTVKKSI